MSKILTIYFSMKGETIAPGMTIVDLKKGHTAEAAEFIQEAVGGDLFEIETVKTYKKDHFEMIEEAKQEIQKNEMPELKALPENLDEYDTVFVGFPNWWNQLPMPVISFLKKVDLSGKEVYPFNTSEGSGAGKGPARIKQICTGANVHEVSEWKGSEVTENHAKLDGKSMVNAAVFGGGRHTWRLRQRLQLKKKDTGWKITEAVASTY